ARSSGRPLQDPRGQLAPLVVRRVREPLRRRRLPDGVSRRARPSSRRRPVIRDWRPRHLSAAGRPGVPGTAPVGRPVPGRLASLGRRREGDGVRMERPPTRNCSAAPLPPEPPPKAPHRVSTVEARVLEPGDYERWSAFVRAAPSGSAYSLPAYLEALCRAT